ncbi:hypothetical protein LR69_03804 [Geobacillus sp. BCO2]|nr:hypothetical protein LR69_03804 [Geobacillus sp. BCO2]
MGACFLMAVGCFCLRSVLLRWALYPMKAAFALRCASEWDGFGCIGKDHLLEWKGRTTDHKGEGTCMANGLPCARHANWTK